MQTSDAFERIPGGYPPPNDGTMILLFYCGDWAVGYKSDNNYFYANDDPYEFAPTAWTFLPPNPE